MEGSAATYTGFPTSFTPIVDKAASLLINCPNRRVQPGYIQHFLVEAITDASGRARQQQYATYP